MSGVSIVVSVLSRPWVYLLTLGIFLVIANQLSRQRSIVMRIPARHESIRSLWEMLSRLIREARLDDQAAFHCRLALDEACVNIIEHAYANNPAGVIEVAIRTAPGCCTISLTDFGEPYDPAQIPSPKLDQPIDEVEPGGLGLYLMRTLMDEVRYTPGPHGNSLIMVKRRPAH
jgi:serine/threonine-protein kinase RsbW